MTGLLSESAREIAEVDRWAASNYAPLPVVAHSARGAWITDVEGRRYLDLLAAYSALNFGHGHPHLLAAAPAQLDQVTLVSRAFHHDQLGRFCARLAALCGNDTVPGPPGPRRAGQAHARCDRPPGAAADDQRGGPGDALVQLAEVLAARL